MDTASINALLAHLDPEVWVVTAAAGARRGGLVATSVAPASIVPEMPRTNVAVARQHHTAELIETAGAFALHLLGEEQLDWVWRFGLQSGRDRDKLAGLRWRGASPAARSWPASSAGSSAGSRPGWTPAIATFTWARCWTGRWRQRGRPCAGSGPSPWQRQTSSPS